MAIYGNQQSIQDASKSVEDLLVSLSALKLVHAIYRAKKAIDPDAFDSGIRGILNQLQLQLEVVREHYIGNSAACIRALAYRRPVSAHDLIVETAGQIVGVIHTLQPWDPAKFISVTAQLVTRIDDIQQGEVFADRDRALANVVEQPSKNLALGEPGYLGLIVDTRRQSVGRIDFEIEVDLSGTTAVWELFLKLFLAEGRELTEEQLNELAGESGNARSQAKRALAGRLGPLGITIAGNRANRWKLVAQT